MGYCDGWTGGGLSHKTAGPPGKAGPPRTEWTRLIQIQLGTLEAFDISSAGIGSIIGHFALGMKKES